jgi:AcrR family transcriptional regulator
VDASCDKLSRLGCSQSGLRMNTKSGASRSRKAERRKSVVELNAAAGEQRQPSARSAPIKRAILDAAINLFAECGYSGTNLQDVADAMGMSRTGLYYHFPSKESILHALVEEIASAPLQNAKAVEELSHRNPAEALREFMSHNVRWILTHGLLFRVLDRSEGDLPEELRVRHNKYKRATLNSVVTLIERGILIGQFRPVDPKIAAFSMIGMANWTVWWFKPEGRIGIESVVNQLTEAMLQTVLRTDSHRSRSDQVQDVLRVLTEDLAHLKILITTER